MESFPNIETLLVGYLSKRLPECSVATRVPRDLTSSVVRVWRLGGARRNLVRDQVNVAIQVWAASAEDAWRWCEQARQALLELSSTRLESLSGKSTGWAWHLSETSAPILFPDPDSTLIRYQTVHSLLTKLEVET